MLGRYRERVRAWTDPVGRVLFRLRLRPNHLTVIGLGVSLLAASAFSAGRTLAAGLLLITAGLCDFFDGALARVSGQVTPFGAFLDSVIDRYSDLVVLLGIVVFFARMPHTRGAIVAMAGLIGSMMVSYTKARAESIGVKCAVGMMERPERMICLIAGALFQLLEPALWVLAILANLTALQRILFTWRATRGMPAVRPLVLGALLLAPTAAAAAGPPRAHPAIAPETERAWAQAVLAYQGGEPGPLLREFGSAAARASPIGDHVRFLLAQALAQVGDVDGARATAVSVAERYRESRLAPRALLLAATFAFRAGDDAQAQVLLRRLVDRYPDAPELPEALYLLAMSAEALGQRELAARTYRELRILMPASDYADGGADRLAALEAEGVRVAPLTLEERIDRAERLLRGGVSATASDEAERLVAEVREPSVVLRALRVVAESARKPGRYEIAARALQLALTWASAAERPALELERGKLLVRAGQNQQALVALDAAAATGGETEASEALYRRARILDDVDRRAEAAVAYRLVATRYPSREVAAASLWHLGWLAWLAGDLRGAVENWTRLTEPGVDRGYRIGALYWAGRARAQQGDAEGAERLFTQVLAEAPRTYHGVLAAARLPGRRATGAKASVALPVEPSRAVAADPGWARFELLRRIGLVEEGVAELEDVAERAASDPVRLYAVSSAYVQEERYHLALRIFRRSLAPLAVTGDPALPNAFWETFYPFGWRSEVMEAATRSGLDPYLVAALVREESSYHPRALSRAGARGLMQLMPETALPMVPGKDAREEHLDDPAQNLRLGARFLAGLLRDFRDPRVALAAYNAGPRRVRQWWNARRTDDIEAWVELIPYDETRLYVKRVVLAWDQYRLIYAGR
jgi:soluble lytic murein transglycosylase